MTMSVPCAITKCHIFQTWKIQVQGTSTWFLVRDSLVCSHTAEEQKGETQELL
jgi:hypothetical protein